MFQPQDVTMSVDLETTRTFGSGVVLLQYRTTPGRRMSSAIHPGRGVVARSAYRNQGRPRPTPPAAGE